MYFVVRTIYQLPSANKLPIVKVVTYIGILTDVTDDADLVATDFDDHRFLEEAVHFGLVGRVHVGAEDGHVGGL